MRKLLGTMLMAIFGLYGAAGLGIVDIDKIEWLKAPEKGADKSQKRHTVAAKPLAPEQISFTERISLRAQSR